MKSNQDLLKDWLTNNVNLDLQGKHIIKMEYYDFEEYVPMVIPMYYSILNTNEFTSFILTRKLDYALEFVEFLKDPLNTLLTIENAIGDECEDALVYGEYCISLITLDQLVMPFKDYLATQTEE